MSLQNNWRVATATVRGRAHEQNNSPCQDRCETAVSADREWVAVAICDGAGSAPYSDVGAEIVSQEIAHHLISLGSKLKERPPGEWIIDCVIDSIVQTRNKIREAARGDDLRPYHCTLVAALIGKGGGFSLHIGDGAIFGGPSKSDSGAIDLAADLYVSEPQNGEYANETVFVTEKEWIKNIRINPMPPLDWVILGTDGGMALAWGQQKHPKQGFVKPILNQIIASRDDKSACKILSDALSDPQSNRLTNDDKTLAVIVRAKINKIENEFIVHEENKFQQETISAPENNPTQTKSIKIKSSDPQSLPYARLLSVDIAKRVLLVMAVGALCVLVVFGFNYLRNARSLLPENNGPRADSRNEVPDSEGSAAINNQGRNESQAKEKMVAEQDKQSQASDQTKAGAHVENKARAD